MNHRIVGVAVLLVGLAATVPAQAQTREDASTVLGTVHFLDQATVDAAVRPLASLSSTVTFLPAGAADAMSDQARPPTVAFEYSDAYQTRARIHKIASMFMLPLFAAEGIVGQSLYNDPNRNDAKRSAHGILSGAIGGLFAVNSVTGVWNLIEARHDPNGRRLRTVHGILMLAADAGFLATAMLAPDREHDGERGVLAGTGAPVRGGSAATHRAVAFGSIGVGTIGYLIMLFGGH